MGMLISSRRALLMSVSARYIHTPIPILGAQLRGQPSAAMGDGVKNED